MSTKSLLTALTCLCGTLTPATAQETLFAGAPYEASTGEFDRALTFLTEFTPRPQGASGRLVHRQSLGSFALWFDVDCITYAFQFQTDLGRPAEPDSFHSFEIFPDWTKVTFPDGTEAALGPRRGYTDAETLANTRYQDYVAAGEAEGTTKELNALTSAQIVLHAQRLRFIGESLFARACF